MKQQVPPPSIKEALERKSTNLAYSASSIDQCMQEPIRFCGAVQPFSFFLAVHQDRLTIEALSDNWQHLLGAPSTDTLLGTPLDILFDLQPRDCCLSLDDYCDHLTKNPPKLKVDRFAQAHLILDHCYHAEPLMIFEYELAGNHSDQPCLNWIQKTIKTMDSLITVDASCQLIADQLRVYSGYDRVMIYRFDPQWNGEVIAEARADSLASFLHLKYPATDIPPQARELFSKNRPRMIPDARATAVAIKSSSLLAQDIDLGPANGRAVSPFHLQYLEHMGVRASCSFAILVDQKLWGLIACHHYCEAKTPTKLMRATFELLAQTLASKITALAQVTRVTSHRNAIEYVHSFLNTLALQHDVVAAFEATAPRLLDITASSAAFIKIGDQHVFLGAPIEHSTLMKLCKKLQSQASPGIWYSNCLMQDLGLDSCDRNAAGALAVPIAGGFRDLVIWFRPEQVQEIRWGGSPEEPDSATGGPKLVLTPRQSFAEWKQLVADCCRPWTDSDLECAEYFLSDHVREIMARMQILAKSYKELERQDRAKDEFISTVSHELRTPLGIIIGWIHVLKDDPSLSLSAKQAIDILERNAKAQTAIIEDLLDMFRIKSGKLRVEVKDHIDIQALISKVVESMRPAMTARGIRLLWDPPAKTLISVDPDRFCQILWNLLSNAQKFTPPGGEIRVSVAQNEMTTVIEVKDTGVGIEPSMLDHIFERFVQDNSEALIAGGLGIGLSMVRGLTEMHGGTVRAYSEGLGKGARLVIELPNKNLTTAFTRQSQYNEREAELLKGLQVLIAEDQPDALLALSLLCERLGGKVTTAKDGREAIELLTTQSFDLILSDLSMPGIDGCQVLKFWRHEEELSHRPRVPAIAVSAYASPKDRAKSLEAGFNAHIGKPVYLDEFHAVIKSLGLTLPDTQES